jgi:hypothetical protein
MRCPECGADGSDLAATGPVCNRCLGSGRVHIVDRPIGELGRFLELTRRLREQNLSSETRPVDVVRIRPVLVADDQDREPIVLHE